MLPGVWRPFGERGPSWWELTVQALSSTEAGYDRLAPRFDFTPFRTPEEVLVDSLDDLGRVDAAVDLCCGTGAALAHLDARRRVGLDTSRAMLARARSRVPGAELLRADVLHPPEALEGRFDLATCFGAFGHIAEVDEPRFVAAVATLLRPGGRFVFVTGEPTGLTVRRAMAHAFNLAMRVRNALWSPAFVMVYLTFELPRARALLTGAGFDVHVERGRFAPRYPSLVRVVATKRGASTAQSA